jgi:hypothetical protein
MTGDTLKGVPASHRFVSVVGEVALLGFDEGLSLESGTTPQPGGTDLRSVPALPNKVDQAQSAVSQTPAQVGDGEVGETKLLRRVSDFHPSDLEAGDHQGQRGE